MTARSSREEQKKRRRRRLLKGLLVGGAAVGIPALANALMARAKRQLPASAWGRPRGFAWSQGEVSFQQLGAGDPILLVHAFGPGHDSEEWRPAAELLAESHTVYAIDLLGWGRSEKPRITYDGELYIQLLVDFLTDVVRERAVIAAAGLSATYAVQVAVDRPELVRALALVGPSGMELRGDEPDLKDALVHRLLRLPILGTSALNLYTSQTGLSYYLKREMFSSPDRVDAGLTEHHYRSSHQPGGHTALAAYLSGYLNHHPEEALTRLNVPVALFWGRNARVPAVEAADLWLHRNPQAELEVIADCGALPHRETPGRFVQKLGDFLRRV